MSIQPDYDSNGKVNGYRVEESLTVTLRDLDTAGATMTAAINAGGNKVRVDGVSVGLDSTSALVSGARTSAVEDAKAKATQYAEAAGRTLGGVVSISESVQQSSPIAYDARAMSTVSGAVPIQAGSQDVTVQVTVVYAFA
jgi:hypothetical protein